VVKRPVRDNEARIAMALQPKAAAPAAGLDQVECHRHAVQTSGPLLASRCLVGIKTAP
jgi:hypothetical protein